MELELQNGVSVLFLNTLGNKGEVSPLIKNFLQYVNDHVPKDDFTREVEEEVVRLRYDKEVRNEFMVLSTRLKVAEMVGVEKKSREVAINMLKDGVALQSIEKYLRLSKEELLKIAKEQGIEVVED